MTADRIAFAGAPDVRELLDIDAEFRRQSSPVLHSRRGDRAYTAFYSPTPLARRLRRDRDWVLIHLETKGAHAQARWTVVTERRGVLKGKRVVRSREVECFWHYKTRKRGRSAA